MKFARLILLAALLLPIAAPAQRITSTRVSDFDYQCQEADGTRISNHVRQDKAAEACQNISLQDGKDRFVQGGRWRVTASRPKPPAEAQLIITGLGPSDVSIFVGRPAQFTDGAPIASPMTFRIYRHAEGAAPEMILETADTQPVIRGNPSGTQIFHVTVVVDGVEGAPSPAWLKVFP